MGAAASASGSLARATTQLHRRLKPDDWTLMKAKRFLPPLNALGIQRHDACVLYRCFEKLDADQSGSVDHREFDTYFQLKGHRVAARLFALMSFEAVKSFTRVRLIGFLEFVVFCFSFCALSMKELTSFAFKMYADGGSRFLSTETMTHLLSDTYGLPIMVNGPSTHDKIWNGHYISRHGDYNEGENRAVKAIEAMKKLTETSLGGDRKTMRLTEAGFAEFAQHHPLCLQTIYLLQQRLVHRVQGPKVRVGGERRVKRREIHTCSARRACDACYACGACYACSSCSACNNACIRASCGATRSTTTEG